MCSCFASHVDEGLIPSDDHYAPRPSQTPTPQLQAKMPKRKLTSKRMSEANVSSWEQSSQDQSSSNIPTRDRPATGRRSRGASASHGSLPCITPSDNKRSDDPTGNMLYFGASLSPEQALRVYKSSTPASGSSSSSVSSVTGKSPAVASNASGRDASGYLSSSVGSQNIMNGTYSSLTYGGSLQYNYAGTQSYGAGTGSGAGGDGLL